MADQGQVNSLYVGSLPKEIDEEALYLQFQSENAPQIASLRIVRPSATDGAYRLPYAYINFNSPEDADKVYKEFNFKVFKVSKDGQDVEHSLILQKHIKPGQFPTDANVYTSGDFSEISAKQVYDYFASEVQPVSFKVREHQPSNKTAFYVQYEKKEDADAVIAKVEKDDGIIIGDKKIVAKTELFKPSGQRGCFTNVFVRNFPVNYTIDQLKDLASKYGTVTSVFVPERFPTKPGENSPSKTGYGFFNYATPEEAKVAIEKFNQEVIGDFKLAAFQAVSRDSRSRQVKQTSAMYSQSRATTQSAPYNNRQYHQQQQQRPYHHQQQRPGRRLAKAVRVTGQLTPEQVAERLPDMAITRVTPMLAGTATLIVLTTPEDAAVALKKLEDLQARFRYPTPRTQYYRYPRYPRRRMHPHYQQPMYPQPYGYPPYGYPPQMMQHPPQQHPAQQQTFNTQRQQRQQRQPRQHHPQHQAQQQYSQDGPLSETERQQVGSSLYYKIQPLVDENPELTGKITGMLLELPAAEVRQLAADGQDALLSSKVQEAREVLLSQRQ